jgi:hypothetical protein
MPRNICCVDELMCIDHNITTDELCPTLSIGKGSVMAVIEEDSFPIY